jgi:hypothetical protein
LGDGGGRLSGEHRELLAEISIGETSGRRNQTRMCHNAGTRRSAVQRRFALPPTSTGQFNRCTLLLPPRSHGQAVDFEKTSVGWKANLPQSRQIFQPFADVKVTGIVDGSFGAGSAGDREPV